MIPIKDDIQSARFPWVNSLLIAANVLVFLYEAGLGPEAGEFIREYGLVPVQLVTQWPRGWQSIFSSMFIHGGWEHIIGNMLYLFIFGDNVEDALGSLRYLLFYLLCGAAASWSQVLSDPGSTLPMVGASGAVAGVLGAYLLLYPRAGVLTLIPLGLFIRVVKIPAVVVLGFWIVLQVIFGLVSLPLAGQGQGGVAWFAHIGGFGAGLLLVKMLSRRRR
jgi:membrane associated rhomboid family serine protease